MDARSIVEIVGRQQKDSLGIVLESDLAVTELLGWTANELRGHRVLEFLHPDDRDGAVRSFMVMLKGQTDLLPTRVRHRHKDGHFVPIDITNRNVLSSEGYVVTEIKLAPPERPEEHSGTELSGAAQSVSQQTPEPNGSGSPQLFASLVAKHERTLRAIVESLPAGVIQIAANKCVTLTNTRASLLLGAKSAQSVEELFACVVDNDRTLLRQALRNVLQDAKEGEIELRIVVPGRPVLSVVGISFRVLSEPGIALNGAILCVEDATETARNRSQSEPNGGVDPLTVSQNRASTVNALRTALRMRQDVAVLFFDIDRMRTINDRFGKSTGDRVIASVAHRLAATKRIGDVVGRVSGDKFVVVCSRTASPENGVAIARRFASILCQPTEVGATTLNVGVSIGVAHASTAGLDPGQLLSAAEAGSVEAKRYRDGEPVLYDPAAHARASASIDSVMAAAVR